MFQPEPKLNQYLKPAFWLILIASLIVITFVITRGDDFVVRDQSAYQAVFLSNDQVYFGKLKPLNDDFVSLTDVYYLRAGSVQRGGETQGQVDLIKLGAELHAPRDEMIISKEHIVFYEDIGSQSEIMRLINQHKSR